MPNKKNYSPNEKEKKKKNANYTKLKIRNYSKSNVVATLCFRR